MTPDEIAFRGRKMIEWVLKPQAVSRQTFLRSYASLGHIRFRLGELHELTHKTVMLRSGLAMGFVKVAGHA